MFPPAATVAQAIVEQLSDLRNSGVEVILVTSGAVGCGRMQLRRQALLGANFHDQLRSNSAAAAGTSPDLGTNSGYNSACASAGQLGLMSLYSTLFTQCDVSVSQFLVTSYDFTDEGRRAHLRYSMEQIIRHGMVPIVNENDAISGNKGYTAENVFSDNDALASLVAGQLGVDVLLLLTDVEGLFDKPPSEPGAKVIDVFSRAQQVIIGDKSARGRGGMGAKVDSACKALEFGTRGVVIASGKRPGVILDVIAGMPVGTLFIEGGAVPAAGAVGKAEAAASGGGGGSGSSASSARDQAVAARAAARALRALSPGERADVLLAVAAALRNRKDEVGGWRVGL